MKFRLHNVITFLVLILTVVLSIGFVCASDVQNDRGNSADGSVSAVENSGTDSVVTPSKSIVNNASISTDSKGVNNTNNDKSVVSKSNSVRNVSISGKVIRCDSGLAFKGVTIKVFDLKGNLLKKTQTDKNGLYNIVFDSKDSVFKVTASYPGHITMSKNVRLYDGKGVCDFQLGPEPKITINPNNLNQFVNEDFKFEINFDNTGNETGFGPIVYLRLPPEVEFKGATFLGQPVNAIRVGVFPSNGTLIDPLTKKPVTGTPGETFYVLEYPLGSFTKGQPIAKMEIIATLRANATLGKPLNITATPVFRFGANETGSPTIVGNNSTLRVIPTVIKITKVVDTPENEITTGKSNPHRYRLIIDIANGQIISNITLKDILPGNIQFLRIIDNATGREIRLPNTNTPGGLLEIFFDSITGTLSSEDRVVIYEFYAPKLDNESKHVLNPNTGLSENATNNVNVSGKYKDLNVSAKDNHTVMLKSIATQKYVKDITGGNKTKPKNILEYLINFQISDYFSFDNIVIYDTLGDGQTFLNDPLPNLIIQLPNGTVINIPISLTDFTRNYDSTTGITYLKFNISAILIKYGYGGVLTGCHYYNETASINPLRGNLTFRSQINTNFTIPNKNIVSNDIINNNVIISGNLTNQSAGVSDYSGSEITIVAPKSNKFIVRINGKEVSGSNFTIRPGDNITFSLEVNIPTTNLHNFVITDYLPIPLFRALQFATGQSPNNSSAIPVSGQWRLGDKDTLFVKTGKLPYLTVDTAQNRLIFNYGDIDLESQEETVAHILFTVTATGDRMADGLHLANLLNIMYDNTTDSTFSEDSIVHFVTGMPNLSIQKNATPKNNLEAGDTVTYNIIIKNKGNSTAYNIVVRDNFLIINGQYFSTSSIKDLRAYRGEVEITDLNLWDLFTDDGLSLGNYALGVDPSNNTILITYKIVLPNNVTPLQVFNNTVQITNFTSLPNITSPNFVDDPRNYEDNESIQVKNINFTKNYTGSKNGPSKGNNLTIGETGKYRLTIVLPAGQVTNITIKDTLPNGLKLVGTPIINKNGMQLPNYDIIYEGNSFIIVFKGVVNTEKGGINTFYVDYEAIVLNNATLNPVHTTNRARTNIANLTWADPYNRTLTSNATVNIIEPKINTTKKFSSYEIQGGKTVTITITIRNDGMSKAYNLTVKDYLANAEHIFDLNSVVEVTTPTGFTFKYDPATKVVTYTGGDLDVGESATFYFNVTVLSNPYLGQNYVNYANVTYWSLPIGAEIDPEIREYNSSGNATIVVKDPSLNKTFVNSTIYGPSTNVTIGDKLTYRIMVKSPKGNATNIILVDRLPEGYRFLGYTLHKENWAGNLGNLIFTQNGRDLIFKFEGLTTSDSDDNYCYIDLEVLVLNDPSNRAGLVKTNFVNLTWDENQKGPFNSSVNTTIVEPNLEIKKSANKTKDIKGRDKLSITITIINNGNSNAYRINISDILDPKFFNSSTAELPVIDGFNIYREGNAIYIVANEGTFIASGDNKTFTFNVTVIQDVYINSTFKNIANVTYSSMPNNTFNETRNYTNKSNEVSFNTINPSIKKNVNNKNSPIGGRLTYTVVITLPEGYTSSLKFKDILPSGLKYIGGSLVITPSGSVIYANPTITTSDNSISVDFGAVNITSDGTITLAYTVLVQNMTGNKNGTVLVNNATIFFVNSSEDESNLSAVDNVTVVEPKLNISKSSNKNTYHPGENVVFTILISHSTGSGSSAYYLIVRDVIPVGLEYVLNSAVLPPGWSVTYDPIIRTLIFSTSTDYELPIGETVTLKFNCTVINSSSVLGLNLTNIVYLNYSSSNNTDDSRIYGPVEANKTINVTITKLDITKKGDTKVVAGGQIRYNITIKNIGDYDAINVILKDILPNYVKGDFYSTDNWATYYTWKDLIDLGILKPGESITVWINATVNASTPNGTILNNTAFVNASNDPETHNDSAITNVTTSANLTINKTGDSKVVAGSKIKYVIVIRNNGPSDALNVTLRDLLPQYVKGDFYSTDNWATYYTWKDLIDLGILKPGESITVWINATVNASTPNGTILNNTAIVTSPTDPNPKNDSAITNVTSKANLTITKVVNVEKIVRGQTIQYMIVITNHGPSDALNVSLYDYFDDSLLLNTYYSTDGSTWKKFNGALILPNLIASLASGSNVTVWVNGTVANNATRGIKNTAITNAVNDPEGNKSKVVETPIQKSHISIKKTVNNPKPYLGEKVYFTLTVKNWGPDTAISVYAIDKLPEGLRYVSHKTNYGSYDPLTGLWLIGDIPKDGVAQLTLIVVVEKLGTIVNLAEVFTNSYDGHPEKHNASASVDVVPKPDPTPTPSPVPGVVGMKNTGMPIPIAVLAILLAFVGVLRVKKR